MLKILQAHLLRAFVANLKIDAIYALYPESFCDENLAVRKVFAFPYSGGLIEIYYDITWEGSSKLSFIHDKCSHTGNALQLVCEYRRVCCSFLNFHHL